MPTNVHIYKKRPPWGTPVGGIGSGLERLLFRINVCLPGRRPQRIMLATLVDRSTSVCAKLT